jgi:hypothetical protein
MVIFGGSVDCKCKTVGTTRFGDLDVLETEKICALVGTRVSLVWFCQVPIAVAVHVQYIPVKDHPDIEPSFGSEYQQAILGLRLVSRLLSDPSIDLGPIGR